MNKIRKEPLAEMPKPTLNRLHTPVALRFSTFSPGDRFCLSNAESDEIKAFMDCFRKLTTMSWQDVKTSGRKGEGKTGLNCTPYKDSDMRKVSRPSSVGDEVQMLGLRAGSAGRLFGYYADHVFYVLWFDSHHEIVPV